MEPILWEIKAKVLELSKDEQLIDWRFANPIPVLSSGKVVGYAALNKDGADIYADVFIDYNIPERLDVEAGTKVWAVPHIESDWGRDVGDVWFFGGINDITHLELSYLGFGPSLGEAFL
jgi:hypothetical protein